MEPEHIVEGLLLAWDDLPELLGPENWRAVYRQLEGLFSALQQAQTEGERASRTTDLLRPFQRHPAARDHLRQTIVDSQRERWGDGSPTQLPLWPELVNTFDQLLHPTTVTRYTDITSPRSVPLGERRAVKVGLSLAPQCESRASERLQVRSTSTVEVALHPLTRGLEILDPSVHRLPIAREADMPAVTFYFKALDLAPQRFSLNFWQDGVKIGEVSLEVEVFQEVPGGQDDVQTRSGPAIAERVEGPPIDLDMFVSIETTNGKTFLTYLLHSPNGAADFHHARIRGEAFAGQPDEARAKLMKKIEKLHEGLDVDDSLLLSNEIEDRLESIGHDLYRELFPPAMREAYRQFRDAVRTVQITSEDPWIPWEMVKPYDDAGGGPIIDDDFLAARFQLTRWLSGRKVAAGEIAVRRLACINAGTAPNRESLPYAASEHGVLTQLIRAHPGVADLSPAPATHEAVVALLKQGGLGILHVVGHGELDPEEADEAGILLADSRSLRPQDLHGRIQTLVGRDRPLVFLNACRVTQQGWSWTGLGGWAKRCVAVCGCGAFVGPLWTISDDLAYKFAKSFYQRLAHGDTFGQATEAARREVRKRMPFRPTWLAFTVYAHPNARLVFEPDSIESSV